MGADKVVSSPVRMAMIAATIATAGLIAGATMKLGRTLPPPPPPSPCLIPYADGFKVLDYVDNLETCGARLEVLYLEDGRPVRGAYGGIRLAADDQGIWAAAEDGPRQSLMSAVTRQRVDADIRRLIRARDQPQLPKGVLTLDLSPRP